MWCERCRTQWWTLSPSSAICFRQLFSVIKLQKKKNPAVQATGPGPNSRLTQWETSWWTLWSFYQKHSQKYLSTVGGDQRLETYIWKHMFPYMPLIPQVWYKPKLHHIINKINDKCCFRKPFLRTVCSVQFFLEKIISCTIGLHTVALKAHHQFDNTFAAKKSNRGVSVDTKSALEHSLR